MLVVLTKADLMASPAEVEEVRSHIDGFVGNDELLAMSGRDEAAVQGRAQIIAEGDKTAVLIGRSGVGKVKPGEYARR